MGVASRPPAVCLCWCTVTLCLEFAVGGGFNDPITAGSGYVVQEECTRKCQSLKREEENSKTELKPIRAHSLGEYACIVARTYSFGRSADARDI